MTSRYPVEAPPAARRLWRELAGAPEVLAPSTQTVVRGSRGICPAGWVGVVRLGGDGARRSSPGLLIEGVAAGEIDEDQLRDWITQRLA